MTDCSSSPTLPGSSTRAVHAGEIRRKPQHALIDPIFQTSTYTFDNMAEVCQFQEAHAKGQVADQFEYGRYGNPTVAAAEERLAALENAATYTTDGTTLTIRDASGAMQVVATPAAASSGLGGTACIR